MRSTSHRPFAALVLIGLLVLLVRGRSELSAGTALALDVAGLVDGADLILEGRVLGVACLRDERGRIVTDYRLQVEATHWGADLPTRTIRLPGGVLPDGRGLVVPGMPRLDSGESVLLFLHRPDETGRRMPVGLTQGRLRVVPAGFGRRALVRSLAGVERIDARGRIQPGASRSVVDYEAFLGRMRDEVSARRARQRAAGSTGGR